MHITQHVLTGRSPVQILVTSTCLGCRPGPCLGACERWPTDVSLPFFLPPFPSLKINKSIFKINKPHHQCEKPRPHQTFTPSLRQPSRGLQKLEETAQGQNSNVSDSVDMAVESCSALGKQGCPKPTCFTTHAPSPEHTLSLIHISEPTRLS